MITIVEGFKVDVTESELREHLEKQILHHRTQAGVWEERVAKLKAASAARTEIHEEVAVAARGRIPIINDGQYEVDQAESRVGMHKQRAEYLGFLKSHLITGVIYRFDEPDLIRLEYIGDFEDRAVLMGGYAQIGRI